jgi:hypothetical protein
MTFQIATYKGVSNQITRFGKQYLILANDDKSYRVYCEYSDKHLKIKELPISIEQKRDMNLLGEFEVDYLYEKDGKVVFSNN